MKSCGDSAKLKQFIILYIWSKVTQRWSYGSNVSLTNTPFVPSCLAVMYIRNNRILKKIVYCRILLKVSGLLDLACSLSKSSVCVDQVLSSVTAEPAEAGLTGKHEVREDVNKRKRLAEVLVEAGNNNTLT